MESDGVDTFLHSTSKERTNDYSLWISNLLSYSITQDDDYGSHKKANR